MTQEVTAKYFKDNISTREERCSLHEMTNVCSILGGKSEGKNERITLIRNLKKYARETADRVHLTEVMDSELHNGP